jgi:hypothetical protein
VIIRRIILIIAAILHVPNSTILACRLELALVAHLTVYLVHLHTLFVVNAIVLTLSSPIILLPLFA